MTKRSDVITEARKYLGVKWRHQGRNKNGLDCAGLIVTVANTLGLSDHDDRRYSRRPDGSFAQAFTDGGMIRIPVQEAQEGDVLLFAESSHVCHAGFLADKRGEPSVIHAHALRRMVLEETLEDAQPVIRRPTHAFRFPGLED